MQTVLDKTEIAITCNPKELYKGLSYITKFLPVKSVNLREVVITVCIRENTITLLALVDQNTVIYKLPIEPHQSNGEGSFSIHGKTFSEVISTFINDRELVLCLEEGKLKISSDQEGRSARVLLMMSTLMPPESHLTQLNKVFPEPTSFFTVKPKLLKNSLEGILSFTSNENDMTKQIFKNCLVSLKEQGVIHLQSTDSFKLSSFLVPAVFSPLLQELTSFLLTPHSIREIIHAISTFPEESMTLTLYDQNKRLHFSNTNLSVELVLPQIHYPDLSRLNNSSFLTKVIATKIELIKQLKLMAVMSKNAGFNNISCKIEGGNLLLLFESTLKSKGNATIPVEQIGPDITVYLTLSFLIETLNIVSGDIVSIEVNTPSDPVRIYGQEREKEYYLIMPVRHM